MYPGHTKIIFLGLFTTQLLANYVVVQRWILPRDVIKKVPLRTVTSCVMECSRTDNCAAVGFRKDPHLSKNDRCFLIKLLRIKNKNGTRIKIFALVQEQTAARDENIEKLASIAQQRCLIDVNGGYGNWSTFTFCSKSCGSGMQYRNRSCDQPHPMGGGRDCSILGSATQERACNQHPCPIEGGYGQWTSYGSCTKTCDGGTQQRHRMCDTPNPMHGGKDCTLFGASVETRMCHTNTCPGCIERNTDYSGYDISCATGITSWTRCSEGCNDETRCKFWMWYAPRTRCCLKTSDAGRMRVAGAVAGPRRCS